VWKKTVWSTGLLSYYGPHTVEITYLGTKYYSSTGYSIDIDAVDVIGTL
jgi:hypothetical protein